MKTPVHREIQRSVVTPDRQLPVALPPDTFAEGVRRLGQHQQGVLWLRVGVADDR